MYILLKFHKKQDLYVLNIMQLNPNVTRNINKQLPPEVTKFLMKFPMNQNIIEQ